MDENQPPAWVYIIPLTLITVGGFVWLAFLQSDSLQNKVSSVAKKTTETVVLNDDDVEVVNEQVIDLVSTDDLFADEALVEEVVKEATSTRLGMTTDIASVLLRAHNGARLNVDVPELTWSATLADRAQAWADDLATHGCEFKSSDTRYGENLYSITTNISVDPNPEQVVNRWIGEAQYFDNETGECVAGEDCGHYTQVVWSTTEQLGCGLASCDAATSTTAMWVCQYDPAGNVKGKTPF